MSFGDWLMHFVVDPGWRQIPLLRVQLARRDYWERRLQEERGKA